MKRVSIVLLSCLLALASCTKDEDTDLTDPQLELYGEDLVFAASSSSDVVIVRTDAEVLDISASESWCSAEYDNNKKIIQISVPDNLSLKSRNAVVKVRHSGLSEEIKVAQFGVEPEMMIPNKLYIRDFKSGIVTAEVYSNVDLTMESKADWISEVPNTKSITLDDVKYTFNLKVETMSGDKIIRDGLVEFKQNEGSLTDTIVVRQKLLDSEIYLPPNIDSLNKDKKLKIVSSTVTPSEYEPGCEPEKSFDGDYSTIYSTPVEGGNISTMIFEYELDPGAEILNYVLLHPKTGGSAATIIGKAYVNTRDNPTFQEIGTVVVAYAVKNPVKINAQTPILNPKTLKLEITTVMPTNRPVSFSEVECYESSFVSSVDEDVKFFTDQTFSELRPGFVTENIAEIKNPLLQNIAAYLHAGKYPSEFRVQEYEPYRPLPYLAAELKVSLYSGYENPTGMYFEEGETVAVFVEDKNYSQLQLKVSDFSNRNGITDEIHVLNPGPNIITTRRKGNVYISYYTSNWKSAPNVKVHIAAGQINGYFDASKHTNEDGAELLNNAVSEIFDIKGKYVQLAFTTNSLKNYTMSEMHDLTVIYDSIVGSQYTMMGLRKYNRVPKNRMFGRVSWNKYMVADKIGAGFSDETMNFVINPTALKGRIWGPAHEFGHCNQVRPGMKWAGTAECTNNLYSAWIQYCYDPTNLRLEHQGVDDEIGGAYNAFFKSGIIDGEVWGAQSSGNSFVMLVPLWQLHLYYHLAGEGNSWYKPYVYADIFEAVRNTNESYLSDGQIQVNFVKNACDAAGQDLTDYFKKIGMLKVVDRDFADYVSARRTITQTMIDEAVSYAAKYPKPETDYIYYISANCIDAFKNKKPVIGYYNMGISDVAGNVSKKQIAHGIWRNVVAFETYEGNTLSSATMVGAESRDRTFTRVPYPAGSTRIEAVAYDGTRTLVLGSR
ncbi:MAG: M60 family metallopeptidase [Bacteroidales bacterium]